MSFPKISYCPGTLSDGFEAYSSTCLKKVFNGKRVSHILPYNPPEMDDDTAALFLENRKHISISGVQEKLSLLLDKNKLRLTEASEQGTHILKPIPRDLKNVGQVPANEHLTMQIAEQVYGIQTAPNALIFFQNGDPAYITKRFDVKTDHSKWGVEDFASLAGKTSENAGSDFKYNYSYEELGTLISKFVSAQRVEMEKLFQRIVFNYLISNGDAHLKNFSLIETPGGDYVLSPAYDLINTRIHVDDSDFALSKGLFKSNFESVGMKKNNHVGLPEFYELAHRFSIPDRRRDKILEPFMSKQKKVEELIQRSFLNAQTKRAYLLDYQTRRNRLIRE